ncbi:MAG TPA: hypothetical protein PKH33_16195 [bacterium]|nr:hypothetical protein [bacterium]
MKSAFMKAVLMSVAATALVCLPGCFKEEKFDSFTRQLKSDSPGTYSRILMGMARSVFEENGSEDAMLMIKRMLEEVPGVRERSGSSVGAVAETLGCMPPDALEFIAERWAVFFMEKTGNSGEAANHRRRAEEIWTRRWISRADGAAVGRDDPDETAKMMTLMFSDLSYIDSSPRKEWEWKRRTGGEDFLPFCSESDEYRTGDSAEAKRIIKGNRL